MDLTDQIRQAISDIYDVPDFVVEHPADENKGDLASNVAMVLAKRERVNPLEKAKEIVDRLKESEQLKDNFSKIEVAGPGFINFWVKDKFYLGKLKEVIEGKNDFGKNLDRNKERVIIEFTDPNPFKVFHIGHLMSNAIGESLSRLIEFSGALVCRACYQGDVGIHVAKAIWGIKEMLDEQNQKIDQWEDIPLDKRVYEMGRAYARGAKEYEESTEAKDKIEKLNKEIYQRTDDSLNTIYDLGRRWSLEYFEKIYDTLGTRFNEYFFESDTSERGSELVREFLSKGVFEESQGAIIFNGEKYGLHTRVFINSMGLPTYEAKELGLAKAKFERFEYDKSIIVTANEINDYFKVLIKALSLIYPDLAFKTEHIGHGMLKLKYGKMSSRTGEVVSGEGLIDDVSVEIKKKMEETGKIKEITDVDNVIKKVAVGAIKYSMLKQSPGKDIIFDFETSLSFEGDSGPYLQYAYARAINIWEKGGRKELTDFDIETEISEEERQLIKWMARFEEIAEAAGRNLTPNLICSYLIELSARFNYFYTKCQVNGSEKENLRLMMTLATAQIIKNGLWLLGIETVEKM